MAENGTALATLRTEVVASLIEAAEAGERDLPRLKAYALGNLKNIPHQRSA
jgi:hypothetical protein